MAIVGISSSVFASGTTSLAVDFTNSKRNEQLSINDFTSGYILDVDGTLIQVTRQTADKSLKIVGGDGTTDGFARATADGWYISDTQKRALYNIVRDLAIETDVLTITSNSEPLQQFVQAAYNNYCG